MELADDILDRDRLLREFSGDADLLASVLDAFEREYDARTSRLRAAIEANDRWSLSRESHACKGSVATFFALAAFEAAAAMETERELSSAKENLNRFEGEVRRLRAAIRQILADGLLAQPSQTVTLPPPSPSAPDPTLELSRTPTATAPPPTETPERIGRYAISETLGAGGYGTVYLGWDEQLDRKVAIKVPLIPHGQSDDRLQQEEAFLREARHLARLRHSNIVTVHDIGVDDGRCFIVTEFLSGPDLTRWLNRRSLTWKEAVRIVAEVADGLAAAHAAGIVHRDIKPANTIMTGSPDKPVPVIVDFGLAIESAHHIGDDSIRGTPNYMSPEQARGDRAIDGRTDIYSLGVILYRLLTGRLPFEATSLTEVLEKILNDYPPAPRQFVHHVPRDLERLCLSAIARDIRDRPGSTVDFASDLRAILRAHEPPALNQPTSTRSRTVGTRVLVADDDESTRIKLAADISRWGHAVTTACDGEEAWERFQKGDFQLVLTDWEMPRLDGLQLVERVRAAGRPDYTYIIMLTSRGRHEDILLGLETGADDFLVKPCDRDELNVRLRAGRRIADMSRQLAESNRRLSIGFDAAARRVRSRLPDRDIGWRQLQVHWKLRSSEELGGSVFQFYQVPDGRTRFHLIDVEGSGVAPTLMAAGISDEIVDLSRRSDADLLSVAESLRKRHRDPQAGLPFALFLGEIEPSTRSLAFINAGHPSPLHCRLGQSVGRVMSPTAMIGKDTGKTPLSLHKVSLGMGERLIIFSAGLPALINSRGVALGEPWLLKTATSLQSENASRLVDALLLSADEWCANSSPTEDRLVLVFEGAMSGRCRPPIPNRHPNK